MGPLVLIGDIHGDFALYAKTILKLSEYGVSSIQVGDYGVGFDDEKDQWAAKHSDTLEKLGHRFIRGNHDDPAVCQKLPNYLGDYGYDPATDVFWMGGAHSWDKDRLLKLSKKIGKACWFPDEELAVEQMDKVRELYLATKPSIVITHDCPSDCYVYGLKPRAFVSQNRTSTLLSDLHNAHAPVLWYYGHWHTSKSYTRLGTRFRCIGKNEVYNVTEEFASVRPYI